VAQVHWLDDERFIHDRMLEDMERRVRVLFDRLVKLDSGLALLRFFNADANTLRTIEDIAYSLKRPYGEVERGVLALVDLGLVHWTLIAGLAFFGLTKNSEQRKLVRELTDWQDRWFARSDLIKSVLDGDAHKLMARPIKAAD
jgi:hypothetical protein